MLVEKTRNNQILIKTFPMATLQMKVPQGSVLGPLLLWLYVNSIEEIDDHV